MNTTEAIQKRRSIRYYDPAFKISKKDIRELIALAMLSATSYSIQHWKFVVNILYRSLLCPANCGLMRQFSPKGFILSHIFPIT
jgi:hypothetical protein